ncbi:serine/threonine-protein kinase [Roseateles violae]|uniref:Serine/threonine-protein kinase n=1 Tax=Roseateles violae TaxID=3058042 RepID=A0ABT8DLZ5_9BURK|nr:serine/threonine-protein kinase [Pelomonas sp. PFR6]MDN3918933.1 serine/threonine-protein kinase [Pelomonas sp. PFR6]
MKDDDAAPGFWRRLLGRAKRTAALADAGPGGLARYRRERELGRGSMGAVYLATDLQTGRPVALKLLALQRECSPEDLVELRQRFMREARAAGRLEHPDIPRVLDAGEMGDDAWIAMEYARGQDLSGYTRPGRLLPIKEVLRVAIRVARVLGYAHSQGVVHRDIKPANVMLDRENGGLKVMDFGIARVADSSRTRTGVVLGTPSFMSPEQLAGLSVDGRSDLYSLGVMLYQLLTGQLPHQSESMAGLLHQIANQPAPDVRSHRPELPEALAQLLALALEKRPELRYASGEQMAQDLEAVLAAGLAAGRAEQSAQRQEVKAQAQAVAASSEAGDSVDPYAQTVRLDPARTGQNPPAPSPSRQPSQRPDEPT